MKKKLLFLAALMCGVFGANADMFEPSPNPLQQSSQNVKIIFHADESGVAALQGLNSDLYAHIGVWTEKGDWQHVKGAWSENTSDKLFKRVSTNTFELTIGDIRTYFGMTDPAETVQKICVIARNSGGNAQTKDFFIDVHPDGFAMALSSDPTNTTFMTSTSVKFTANTTENATIKFYVNGVEKSSVSNAKTSTYTQNFTSPGSWTVKAVANNGKESLEMSKSVIYLAAATAQNYPGGTPKQGAVKNADGTVTFCLAAPGKSNVTIVGSWDNYMPTMDRVMKYQDYNGYRYFWTTVSGLDNTKYYPYYYLVDGKYKVSDPYAHLVLDYVSDKWLGANVFADRPAYPYDIMDDAMLAVYKGNLDDYNWKVKDFKVENPKSITIYELLLRDFTGTDYKADGTIRGAIGMIPYLKNLGITAVELLPIMQFDGNNSWGYNTNNYMAPDKSYGSPNDYKEFIDKCHEAGIAVILDIVFNHTPGLHPWYQMYEKGTSPFYNATSPHDYSVYEDIKQEYALWEQHWIDVLTYWLTTYKVDGFRFDLVKGLGDSNSYGSGTEAFNQSRINRMKRLHAAMLKVNPNVIHINELLASANEETQFGNDGQFQWNNQNGTGIKNARGLGGNLQYCYSSYCSRPALSTVDYMESHDEERLGYAITKDGGNSVTTVRGSTTRRMLRLGSAAAQMLMFPGPKMIWQFGELGADESIQANGGRTDPKKVLWSYLDDADRVGLLEAYKALCHLRKDNPDLFGSTSVTPTINGFADNATSTRSIRLTSGDKEVVLLVNPNTASSGSTGISVTTTKINANNYQVIAKSKGFDNLTVSGAGNSINVTVPNNSFCVLASKAVAGVDEVIADEVASSAKVYGGNGEIIVSGEYNNVEVYNMSGMRMPSLKVASGLYIVNVDGNVTKVAVR